MKQDLLLTGNALTITNKTSPTEIDLSISSVTEFYYRRQISYTFLVLQHLFDLTDLKNDADASRRMKYKT